MPSEKVLKIKKQMVENLVEKLKNAAAGVIIDYKGITVEQDTKLRRIFREAGVEYTVVKNTLLRFAVKEADLEDLTPALENTTAIAVSTDDPVAPAKIIKDFLKENDGLEMSYKAGFVDGKVLTLDEIKALADLPSRETLIATLANVLNANISGLAIALNAIVEKNGEENQAAGE